MSRQLALLRTTRPEKLALLRVISAEIRAPLHARESAPLRPLVGNGRKVTAVTIPG
jgi:hypothetical protein